MKNKEVFASFIQISGAGKNENGESKAIGLLNFTDSLKGKLRRKLSDVNVQLANQHEVIKKEIEILKKSENSEKEIDEFLNEDFNLMAWEAIPVSWTDEIDTSKYIDIDFLISVGIIFDDSKTSE